MRTLVSGRVLSVVMALLVLGCCSAAVADNPGSAPPRPSIPSSPTSPEKPSLADLADQPDAYLQRALGFERDRNWSSAIEVYDKALERWPDRSDLVHRRRLCDTHHRIVRRYQDQSFRNVLLRLPRDRAMQLYDELLERILTHYVDPVPLEPLLRRGLDNLEVALRDPNFIKTNVGDTSPERVAWLRDALRKQRARLAIPDRQTAEAEVLASCELARRAIGLSDAPVILEFTFGACDALDDYTSYLTPDKLDDLYAMIDGNFVGLGIELKLDTQGLRLVGVIRGGPAWESGLKVGDQITHIAGRAVKNVGLDEAANQLQGTEGSAVEIRVLHPDGTSQAYRMVRRHVEVESVANAKMVDPAHGLGYLQLTGFQKSSTEELDKAISQLQRQGLRALVLDLRGNPGGLLNIAVEIAERFIDNGIIVSTRGRAAGQSQVYRASSRAVWKMPLYVLIDHDSASASEILAGALKDHHRAVIVGESKSYGKGSVQSIFALRSAPTGLKLTTAKFYSPKNRPYSEQGVEPDLLVRVAAKPADGTKADESSSERFGDPETDPVLSQALKHATSTSNASR
ncbi:MAG: S41 family peptidase [Isosphaeraceae bacterium]